MPVATAVRSAPPVQAQPDLARELLAVRPPLRRPVVATPPQLPVADWMAPVRRRSLIAFAPIVILLGVAGVVEVLRLLFG